MQSGGGPLRPSSWLSFVSPNVEEGLNFKTALAKLDSPEEEKLVQEAHKLLGEDGAGVQKSVGEWLDGAENSSVLTMETADKRKLDYVAAKLGMDFAQKQVISFVHDENGKDVVWTLHSSGSVDEARAALDKVGIVHRTLVPGNGGTTVHVFDQGKTMTSQIGVAALAMEADVSHIVGNGEFIGGDTREEGRQIFARIVGAYEKARRIGAAGYRWLTESKGNRLRGRGTEAQESSLI